MRNSLSDATRVEHILEAIATIDRHLSDVSIEAFVENELLTNLAAMQVSIIGEALGCLSESFREKHPHLPYSEAKDMRNFIMHEYFGINYEILWRTCVENLPELKEQLEAIQKNKEV